MWFSFKVRLFEDLRRIKIKLPLTDFFYLTVIVSVSNSVLHLWSCPFVVEWWPFSIHTYVGNSTKKTGFEYLLHYHIIINFSSSNVYILSFYSFSKLSACTLFTHLIIILSRACWKVFWYHTFSPSWVDSGTTFLGWMTFYKCFNASRGRRFLAERGFTREIGVQKSFMANQRIDVNQEIRCFFTLQVK